MIIVLSQDQVNLDISKLDIHFKDNLRNVVFSNNEFSVSNRQKVSTSS